MKLQIEKWVEETDPFVEQARELFDESVMCYKVGAYKSAFLMSYLAFKLTVRYRILECDYRPEKFEIEARWEKDIAKELRLEDTWETQVNEIIEASDDGKKKIIHFDNSPLVKNEYIYWRNTRNACAHAKKNIIDSSTIECFWNYLQDNMGKFYVLGGKSYLLTALLDYYMYVNIEGDPKKLRKLLYDVKIVYKGETKQFFEDFIKEALNINSRIIDENNKSFWSSIINSNHVEIQTGIVQAIITNRYWFMEFYKHHPHIIMLSRNYNQRFIVDDLSCWIEDWCSSEDINKYYWQLLYDTLKVFSNELNIDKIANDFTSRLLRFYNLSEEETKLLNKHVIFKKFIKNCCMWFFKVDSTSQFKNFTNDEDLVVAYFSYVQWDQELLNLVNSAYIELKSNIGYRDNYNSISNGKRILGKLEKIMNDNKAQIDEFVKSIGVSVEEYEGIHQVISA